MHLPKEGTVWKESALDRGRASTMETQRSSILHYVLACTLSRHMPQQFRLLEGYAGIILSRG
jgi:hypothetical protein